MLYHIAFEYPPDARGIVHDRFVETGAPPPPGVTLIGRWHAAGGNGGWLVAESAEVEAVAGWLHDWSDCVLFEVTPVLTDAGFRAVVE